MARSPKYLRERNRYDFLIDKVVVNFWNFSLGFHRSLARLNFNDQNQCHLEIPGVKNQVTITKLKSGRNFKLRYQFYGNINKILVEDFEEKFKKPFGVTISQVNSNFLPVYLRQRLNKKGISLSEVRERGISIFYRQLCSVRDRIIEHLNEDYHLKLTVKDLGTAIESIELDWDLLTKPGVHLARKKNIVKRLNEHVTECQRGSFIDSKGNTCFPGSEYEQMMSCKFDDRDVATPMIKVRFGDGSEGIIYQKEDEKQGSINRLERRFNREHLDKLRRKKIISGRTFRSKRGFKEIIAAIATVTFNGWLPAFELEVDFTDYELKKRVEALISRFYNHLSSTSFEYLWRGSQCIRTHRDYGCDRRVIRKTLALIRQHGKACPVKMAHRGKYILNWHYIKNDLIS